MILQIDTENADRDLTSQVTVLTHTPSATEPIWCKGLVMFGDGTKNLDGTGGDFELTITVGGNTIQPDPQTIAFSTAARAGVWTTEFPVPANAEVVLKAKSPNAGDSDVDVTAYLYQVDKVDILAIGGDKQSATDLKDFADTGYDPATHKVAEVSVAGSVTGAVGSVTGNVGGNVTGSVGSVVGAVGSVTGAVGSVTAPVTVGTNSDKTGYELSAGGVTAVQSGLSTFDPTTDEVDIGAVKGVAVTGVDDFKADVSGLSTFDASADTVDANIVQIEGATEADTGMGWLAWFKRMLSIKDGNSDVEVVGANHVVTFKDRAGNPETVHTVVTATGARTRS